MKKKTSAQIPIRRGDVVLIPFPYIQDFAKAKRRPALVIQNDVGNQYSSNTIVALISSTVPSKLYPMHVRIPAGYGGLEQESIVKTEVILTYPQKSIVRKIGSLPGQIMDRVNAALKLSLDLT